MSPQHLRPAPLPGWPDSQPVCSWVDECGYCQFGSQCLFRNPQVQPLPEPSLCSNGKLVPAVPPAPHDLLRRQKFSRPIHPETVFLPPHEGGIANAVLCAPLPLAFSAVRTLLHKLQTPLLFSGLHIRFPILTAPIVRFLGTSEILRLLRLLRPHFSFVSFFPIVSHPPPPSVAGGIMERLL